MDFSLDQAAFYYLSLFDPESRLSASALRLMYTPTIDKSFQHYAQYAVFLEHLAHVHQLVLQMVYFVD